MVSARGPQESRIAVKGEDRFQWFWIGTHAEYDTLIRRSEVRGRRGAARREGTPENVAKVKES